MGIQKKIRLDVLLVERGLARSRQVAQSLIMSAQVLVSDQPIDKPGYQVSPDAEIRLRGGKQSDYVSRGGDKLQPALAHFNVQTENIIAADFGASTGGFTDVLLRSGVRKVYAVDVGTNQLDYKLRCDMRVVVMEQSHILHLEPDCFSPAPQLAVVDLSFIGLRRVLPTIVSFMKAPFQIIALVKPQFELGPEHVGKGGLVRDSKMQLKAVSLVEECAIELGLASKGYVASTLRGEKSGNQEYFICFEK